MERMIIKHLSGSKANQVEEFALKHHNELIFGREDNSTVKYDPDRDDLVGRQHAKIQLDPNDPNGFIISDLSSRNGTFVNNTKITMPTKITAGDVVQFGPNGPKFQFDVEPRPMSATKPTRIADIGKTAPETRVTPNQAPAMNIPIVNNSIPTAVTPKAGIGKATVERMISDRVEETKQQEGRKYATVGGAAAFIGILLIGSLAFGGYYYNNRIQKQTQEQIDAQNTEIATKAKELEAKNEEAKLKIEESAKNSSTSNPSNGMPATEIVKRYSDAVVHIEVAWRLIDASAQSQLYHQYVPNDRPTLAKALGGKGNEFGNGPINPKAGGAIPVYVSVPRSDGKMGYEPYLTPNKNNLSMEIGGFHRGTGFVATTDGFILTNRHVAATWKTRFNFPGNTPDGIVVNLDGSLAASQLVPPPTDWVPEHTKQTGKQYTGAIKGVNDTLRVTMSGEDNGMTATLEQASDRHDVALIKVNVPGDLTKVEINDNYDTIQKGEMVAVMGYPGGVPPVYGKIKSQDALNREGQIVQIPTPTVTSTNIGNILRGSEKDSEKQTFSMIGDVYMLSTNETGSGNSGGPVFDSQGKVVGIFFAGSNFNGLNITYAVPIRYGMEFFKNKKSSGS